MKPIILTMASALALAGCSQREPVEETRAFRCVALISVSSGLGQEQARFMPAITYWAGWLDGYDDQWRSGIEAEMGEVLATYTADAQAGRGFSLDDEARECATEAVRAGSNLRPTPPGA